MAATKSSSTLIARGTQNAAFAQLVSTVATTRSGTTATLTMTSTATLATNDYCNIQGHDLEEYNGIFQITVATGTTITYTIKQDPGASSGTTTSMTVDKVTLSTELDASTAYTGEAVIDVQNYATAPTALAEVWEGVGTATGLVDMRWRLLFKGSASNAGAVSQRVSLPVGSYIRYAVCRNTGQPVDCTIAATIVTA